MFNHNNLYLFMTINNQYLSMTINNLHLFMIIDNLVITLLFSISEPLSLYHSYSLKLYSLQILSFDVTTLWSRVAVHVQLEQMHRRIPHQQPSHTLCSRVAVHVQLDQMHRRIPHQQPSHTAGLYLRVVP